MGTQYVMHIEAKRGWWSGVSTTLCGLTFKVEKATYFPGKTCPTCERIEKDAKRAKKGGRK